MGKLSDKVIREFAKENNISYSSAYRILERRSVGLPVEDYGGLGSGHFGHGGRPGEVGGSSTGGGAEVSPGIEADKDLGKKEREKRRRDRVRDASIHRGR